MDKILVNQMSFYGYHGVFKEETKLGQRFIVDATLELDLSEAGRTDDLARSVNYGEVYQLCQQIVEGKPFKLIEAVAEAIATSILSTFTLVRSCTIKVIKPDPPIPGYYRSVAVEVTRCRK